MKSSYKLFKLFDIDVRIHLTFILLPVFFGVLYAHSYGLVVGLRAFVLVMFIFGFVLAHEFSHSLVAKRFGVTVPQITLYPIGGVASMQRIPREPRKELMIAAVGPFFNFAAALILFFPMVRWLGRERFFSPTLESWPGMFSNVFWANLVLGVFNLIPAFPMDGGRVLRSVLAMRLSYTRATRISVFLGHFFAILFALSWFLLKNWMLVLIAVFIFSAASDEARQLSYEESFNDKNRTLDPRG